MKLRTRRDLGWRTPLLEFGVLSLRHAEDTRADLATRTTLNMQGGTKSDAGF